MLLLITIAAFVSVFAIVYLVISTLTPAQGEVAVRLKALDTLTGQGNFDEDLDRPFAQRVISPLTDSLAGGLVRLFPSAVRRQVDERLVAAGGFGGLNTDGYLFLCCFLAVVLALSTFALATLFKSPISFTSGLCFGVIGLKLPSLLLSRKITARRASIKRDLPDVLDLLTVSVEAGLGFDGALAKLSEKMKGALVEEFGRTQQEMRIGVPRRDALRALGQRCMVDDLLLFTAAVIQADQLGVSIGNVLRVQSAAMRDKRRQRAQEKAMKAPVKMLLPLVMFIFPAVFVVVLGPAAIRIMTTLFHR